MTIASKENKMNDGVSIVLSRMDTHPEEFYAGNDRWKFIYSDYYRDSMTETEKGMIFDKLREIRRAELTARVMTVMVEGMKMDKVKDAGGKAFPQPAVLAGYQPPPKIDIESLRMPEGWKPPR
jgi:hypothetical protein